jgi:hypothetical protein
VVLLLAMYQLPVLARGQLLLSVLVGKGLVVPLLGVLSQMLVLVGDRPMLPVFMGKGLHLVEMRM